VDRPARLCILLLLATFSLDNDAEVYQADFFDVPTDFWLRLPHRVTAAFVTTLQLIEGGLVWLLACLCGCRFGSGIGAAFWRCACSDY
jgi:hypothetical protein